MAKYIIEGGYPLIGKVKLSGAKNAGFKAMIAALLSNQPTTIGNISKVGDVLVMRDLIKSLGAKVSFNQNSQVTLSGQGLTSFEVGEEYGKISRISSMLTGPLLYRFGKAFFPFPGGDKIGKRPIDRHLDGLKVLGAKIEERGEYYFVSAKKLRGTKYRFVKNTHTGTETLILCAVFAQGKTILENAAAEPEVDNLISVLNSMGAKIKRVKKRVIEIEGIKNFNGTKHEVMPDRNEAATFATMALGTRGDIFIQEAKSRDLEAFIDKVKEAGGGVQEKPGGIRFFTKGPLSATYVETEIHPGFMTDWQALWTTLMTQARGESHVVERVFENRFGFVSQLKLMGAEIELYNPKIKEPESFYEFNYNPKDNSAHGAKIAGPKSLFGINTEVKDIRAGATLVLAALIANGETELSGIEHIERGYENLEGKLRNLGAKIYKT